MSHLLDWLSEYLARRKGLLPLTGMALIGLNLLLQFTLPGTWIAGTNLFLHVGILIALLGVLLSWAL
jgi:hypothetical protein